MSISTCAFSFSQVRGTPEKQVGATSRRSRKRVSGLSAKFILGAPSNPSTKDNQRSKA